MSIITLCSSGGGQKDSVKLCGKLCQAKDLINVLVNNLLIPVVNLDAISIKFNVLALLNLPLVLGSGFARSGRASRRGNSVGGDGPFVNGAKCGMSVVISNFLVTVLCRKVLASALDPVVRRFCKRRVSVLDIIVDMALLSNVVRTIE